MTWSAAVVAPEQAPYERGPRFASQTAPTDAASSRHAGKEMPVFDPLFPAATTTSVPRARRAAKVSAKGWDRDSHDDDDRSDVPRLMLTTPISGWLLRMSSSAASVSLTKPTPLSSSTRCGEIVAPGATPSGAPLRFEAMMPATAVPCVAVVECTAARPLPDAAPSHAVVPDR